ncbi:hypothetical protein EB093_04315 [bacterium]|nr:hypothetical protein [bacterium]
MRPIKRQLFVILSIVGLYVSVITASVNTPSTPFSVQVSVSGTGISGVYRFNGPTESGPYVGFDVAGETRSSDTTTQLLWLGGWIGIREKLNAATYLAYGIEAYTLSGTSASETIENGIDGGPFIGIHHYLTDNIYITVFNNPIYVATEKVSGITTTSVSFFTGGIGLGYQF